MKNVLITGGAGFVGANLVRWLLREGHTLHMLLRPDHETWRINDIRHEVRFHAADLNDAEGVARAVAAIRPDWIFHLAAHGAYSWQTDAEEIFQVNLQGTINLIQAALKIGFEAFIHTGSSSEYGFKDHAPTERDWIDPNSFYAISKAAATHFCRYSAMTHDLNIITLRLYSVFGPYEHPDRLMPSLIRKGLEGALPVLVSPETARDYVYVDDICTACVSAANRPAVERGAVYNVGSGIQTSLREVVRVARHLLNISAEPVWGSMEGRHWDTSTWVADPRKIKEELGWEPRYNFEEGFRLMADWYRTAV